MSVDTKNQLPESKEKEQVKSTVDTPEAVKQAAPPVETEEQINWRRFREERKEERKQKEAAEKRAQEKEAEASALKAAMDAILNKPSTSVSPALGNGDLQEESDETRIQRLIAHALSENEKKMEEKNRQRESQELPHKLTSAFSDFNQVCTTENLDYLEFHHPEVSSAFKSQPDSFGKWANIYKYIKKSIPTPDSKKEEKKAERNLNKPQSMSIPGVTHTGDSSPRILDDKRRAENWARMQRVMKGLN